MPFEVQHTVSIEIDEEGMKCLIIDAVKKQDPSISIDDITFTAARNPSRVEVKVTGHVDHSSDNDPLEVPAGPVKRQAKQEKAVDDTVKPAKEKSAEKSPAEALIEEEESLQESEPEKTEEDPLDAFTATEETKEEEVDPFA